MSTPKKLSVRWSIWRITVDADILQTHAPATHAAIQRGEAEPHIRPEDIAATPARTCLMPDGTQYTTIPAVDIANLLMHAQQERLNNTWHQGITTTPNTLL